jgi:hypothetical protein
MSAVTLNQVLLVALGLSDASARIVLAEIERLEEINMELAQDNIKLRGQLAYLTHRAGKDPWAPTPRQSLDVTATEGCKVAISHQQP